MNLEKFLPYTRQSISSDDKEAVSQALSGDIITRGSHVEAFEDAMAEYCGAKYSVAFSNGTAALMGAYHAADLNKLDRILTTPNTFVATVGAAMQLHTTPIFVDIDRSTGNMNLEQLNDNVNIPASRGKTIIAPVHFAGIPVDMEQIEIMINNPDTIVIEDAAHAIGSQYKDGSKVGCCAFSHMTTFSFHPAKNMTTGEGGLVTTNDETLYARLRLFRNNGIERNPEHLEGEPKPWYYEVKELTGNFNFTDFQAALGLSQLKRLDQFAAKRRELISLYRKKLASIEHIRLFNPEYDIDTAYHLCVVQIDFNVYNTTREHVMTFLKDRGIGTQVHYIPVYRHPFFRNQDRDLSTYFPEMELYYAQALSIPLYPGLTEEDVDRVVEVLKISLKN